MKCRTFKIQLDEAAGNSAEDNLNKSLENLNVSQVFASIVNNEFWSVLVFYDDKFSEVKNERNRQIADIQEESIAPKTIAAKKSAKAENAPDEPICLNADEENVFAALREWRNEKAAADGLPPYMIAHNDSLKTMVRARPETLEELIQIKGFGEKRAQKYGDELLQILNQSKNESA